MKKRLSPDFRSPEVGISAWIRAASSTITGAEKVTSLQNWQISSSQFRQKPFFYILSNF